jgi:ABC-type Fe3+ transport system substrate-binding protein
MFQKAVILGLLALILGVPFLMRPASEQREPVGPENTLVIVTPHVPQIQYEFARAFEAWHLRTHGTRVRIDWRQPGATGDILKQLGAQYSARAAAVISQWAKETPEKLTSATLDLEPHFAQGTFGFDLMMGGGSHDHGRLKDLRTGAYWFKPFPDRGPTKVMVRPLRAIDPASVALERQITALVQPPGLPEMTLRIPLNALVEGTTAVKLLADASKPPADISKEALAQWKAPQIECNITLGSVERQAAVTISVPAGFTQEELQSWYGPNTLGAGMIYDPQQHWLGTAISGFGIVFNRDVLAALNVPEPGAFSDLADPRLRGWVVFADPRQSGSVATTIDAMLSYYGWEKGWRVLRETCANTRYYTNTAPRPPIDVSQGEAAAGLCIDFYGRTQSQYVLPPGQNDPAQSRVGYIDPKGATYMDADPISLLRGGPNPQLSKRFIEFVLTEEGQALWQFRVQGADTNVSKPNISNPHMNNDPALGVMGPHRSELRRMPVRRIMYEKYLDFMVDKVNPFETASNTKPAGWRDTIGVMMGAFAIERSQTQYDAWDALIAARANPNFDPATLAEMDRLFHAWPTTLMPDGTELEFIPANVRAITGAWKDASFKTACEVRYFNFFQSNYRKVKELGEGRPLTPGA